MTIVSPGPVPALHRCAFAALLVVASAQAASAQPVAAPQEAPHDLARPTLPWAFSDGSQPAGALLHASDGNLYCALYGTALYGGNGWGTVYRLDPPASGAASPGA